jgi:hypothetical protein
LVAGILAALYGYDQLALLRAEQRRLAEELTARWLMIGFDEPYADGPGGFVLKVARPSVAGGQYLLEFTLKNVGPRTAHDVVVNVRFPPDAGRVTWGGPLPEESRIDRDNDGGYRLVVPLPALNREVFVKILVTLDNPPVEVRLDASISRADAREDRSELIARRAIPAQV